MNTRLINGYTALISRAAEKMGDQTLDQKTRTEYRFKSGHYKKALKKIKELETDITDIETARELGIFTAGELTHIERFLEDTTLDQTEPVVNSRNVELERLQTITGIGPKRAADLLDKHGMNLEKLLNGEGDKYLTHHQRMGVKYYHDLNERIPRNEITKMRELMEKYLRDGFKIMVCGSYRRGVSESGDMDVLVYHPELDIKDSSFFEMYIECLEEAGFLVDSLTPHVNRTKYMGMCQLSPSNKVRRIDIRFIPYSSLASAMLYFTGSGEFNKNMRTFAIKKGYKLNEYGIYDIDKSKDTPTETRLDTSSEKDIFAILNLKYIEPRDRLASVKFK